MQYDENGYPVKGNSSNNSHTTAPSYGAAPTAAAASSSAATPYPPQQVSPYQQQQAESGPRYDERGYPIKPQPHPPQGQQQGGPRYDERGYPIKQPANGNTQPTYAQPGGGSPNVNAYPPQNPTGQSSPSFAHNTGGYHDQTQGPMASYQPFGRQLPQHNYWTTGLCDMFSDCDVCMEGCCCMCCQEGRVYEAVANEKPNTMNVFACCVSFWCFEFPFIDLYNRRKLIEKYNIQEESCCTSLCFSWLCPCLSVCQMQRELQARGVYPGGQCCAPSRDHKAPSLTQPMGGRGYGQQSL